MKAHVFLSLFVLAALSVHGQVWRTLGGYQYNWSSQCTLIESIGDSLIISGGIAQIDEFENVGTFFWDSTLAYPTDWAMNFESATQFVNRTFLSGHFYEWQGPSDTFTFEASGIVSWDGTNWYDEDGVSEGECNAELEFMEVYNGKLFAGNQPNSLAGIENFYQIAAYDGTQWADDGGVAAGFGVAECMAVYSGELYVAGGFGQTSNPVQQAWGIAKYDGTQWYPIADGLYGDVHAMCVDTINNYLYIGGYFFEINGNASNIVRWDGEEFQAMDNPWFDIRTMCMYRNQLYVAGYHFGLDEDGNVISLPDNFFRWDGYGWKPVAILGAPEGFVGTLQEMVVFKDELYIGGAFTSVDTLQVDNVARCYLHPDSVQWGVPSYEAAFVKEEGEVVGVDEMENDGFSIYPNPTYNYVYVSLPELSASPVEFVLRDGSGKQVMSSIISQKDSRIELPELSSGAYTFFILVNGQPTHVGELIIK